MQICLRKNWYKANTLYLLYLNDAILLSGLSIPHHFSFVFQSIGEELVSLEKGSIEGCQAFIKKHSQNLHPNHYYLMVSRHIDKILCVFGYFLFLMLFEKKIFACVEKLSHFSPDSDLRNLKVCGHSLPSLHPLAQNTGSRDYNKVLKFSGQQSLSFDVNENWYGLNFTL